MRGWLVVLAACGGSPPPPPIVVEPPQPAAAPRVDPALATLTGRVILDGKPVRRFAVRLGAFQPGQRVQAATGRFSIAARPGMFDVLFAGPDFAARTLVSQELRAGHVLDLGDITVHHGFTVEGHVRDERGAPIEGATVNIGPWMRGIQNADGWLGGERTTTSDARGVYRLTEVSNGGSLVATLDDRMTSVARDVQPGILDLVLLDGGGLDAESEVIGHVAIRAIRDRARARFVEPVAGVYHYDNLVPGDHDVMLSSERGVAAPLPQRVTVVANQRTRVTLHASATPIRATFTTTLPCREVSLHPGHRRSGHTVAEQDCATGTAVIDGITPGRYEACDADDCKTITVLGSPAQQAFDLR